MCDATPVGIGLYSFPELELELIQTQMTLKPMLRAGLMYGVNLNALAKRHAALHFKATRLQARAVDTAPRIDVSRHPAPPGTRPFFKRNYLEIRG